MTILDSLLLALDALNNRNVNDKDKNPASIDLLTIWNKDIELLLQQTAIPQKKGTQHDVANQEDEESLFLGRAKDASARLADMLLTIIRREVLVGNFDGDLEDFASNSNICSSSTLQEYASTLIQQWDNAMPSAGSYLLCSNNHHDGPSVIQLLLPLILQSCKNWLRYLLIYHPLTSASSPDLRIDFKSTPMLELYLNLIDLFCEQQQQQQVEQEEDCCARYASLILFHATFNPVTGSDESLQQSFLYLKEKRNYFERFLKNLLRAPTAALALTLTRNVHHAAAFFPNTATSRTGNTFEAASSSSPSWFETTVPLSKQSDLMAPWAEAAATIDNSMDHGSVLTSYKTTLREIVLWALGAQPTFPGDPDNRRAELVVEILRIFYAVRMGSALATGATTNAVVVGLDETKNNNSGADDDDQLAEMVLQLLRLPAEEGRSYECQLATISLLMDADPMFANSIFERNALNPLLRALDRQVSDTAASGQIDNSAAAALIPVLVVLHKFCTAHSGCRCAAKEFIFPNEENFQKVVAEYQQRNGMTPKNMAPLDGPHPDGTLRAKMIRLLTWPQGHIKRFTGEFLWILCNSNSAEFIHRVGLGNAMVILGTKGLVELPPQLFS